MSTSLYFELLIIRNRILVSRTSNLRVSTAYGLSSEFQIKKSALLACKSSAKIPIND